MKLSRSLSLVMVCMAFVGAVLSCSSPSSASSGSGGGTGAGGNSLALSIGNQINARNIAPTLSMTAVSYKVSGVGPTSTFGPITVSGTSATIPNLEVGAWTVTVSAYNGDATPTLIGSGTSAATVNASASTPVSISVVPIFGNGSLGLTVTWPAGQVSGIASIQSTLSPAFASAISPSAWTITSGSGSYTSVANSVPTGYSTLVLNLLDGAVSKAWVVDTVRIINQQTTTGTYALTNLNQPGGTVVVNVTTNLQNPLTLSIAGTSPSLTNGVSETLTASALDSLGNPVVGTVTYLWYVDGVVKQTSSSASFSYTGNKIGSNYSASIAVVAYTPAGSYGSANVYQKVQ